MNRRTTALFYVVGFVGIVLVVACMLLSMQEDSPAIAATATGVGAGGFLTCVWMLKRT